jgi:hypothetical protein
VQNLCSRANITSSLSDGRSASPLPNIRLGPTEYCRKSVGEGFCTTIDHCNWPGGDARRAAFRLPALLFAGVMTAARSKTGVFHSISCPVDFSTPSRIALQHTYALTRRGGGRLTVM